MINNRKWHCKHDAVGNEPYDSNSNHKACNFFRRGPYKSYRPIFALSRCAFGSPYSNGAQVKQGQEYNQEVGGPANPADAIENSTEKRKDTCFCSPHGDIAKHLLSEEPFHERWSDGVDRYIPSVTCSPIRYKCSKYSPVGY